MSSSPMVIVVEPPPSRLRASSAPSARMMRALLEASPHAVAWLPAVYGDEKQGPFRRDAGEGTRVAPDAEAVVELGVFGPYIGCYVGLAVA